MTLPPVIVTVPSPVGAVKLTVPVVTGLEVLVPVVAVHPPLSAAKFPVPVSPDRAKMLVDTIPIKLPSGGSPVVRTTAPVVLLYDPVA